MLTNLSELRADVRSLINEAVPAFWTDAEIDRWLNEAQHVFVTTTKCLSSKYSRTLIASDILDGREIRFSQDFIALDEGDVLYNGKPLSPISIHALDIHDPNWRNQAGEPERFYLRSDCLGLYPMPQPGGLIEYYGIERSEPLGISQPFSGDFRTVAFRRHIRDYAVAMCWEKKGELQKSDRKMGAFYQGLHEANNILNSHKHHGAQMVSLRTRARPYGINYGDTRNPIG